MAQISQPEPNGVMRQAQMALRTLGGCVAKLRVPGLAASGDDAEQLGLATPSFQELSLGAASLKKSESGGVLTVAAAVVLQLVQSLAYDSAEVLFAGAAGVVIDATLYTIGDVTTAEAMGSPYLYRLTLQAPAR